MTQQGSDNKDAFMGSAMQFMQAGQNMAQQFMDFIGKAGNPAGSVPPAADPQALTALQEKTLAWKASRGVYALEDTFLAELMDKAGMLARMARKPGLRLPAPGLSAEHEIRQGSGRIDPGCR